MSTLPPNSLATPDLNASGKLKITNNIISFNDYDQDGVVVTGTGTFLPGIPEGVISNKVTISGYTSLEALNGKHTIKSGYVGMKDINLDVSAAKGDPIIKVEGAFAFSNRVKVGDDSFIIFSTN